MKQSKTDSDIESLRSKRIDAVAAELAVVDATIEAFITTPAEYTDYAAKLRTALETYKSRLGSATVHIDELQLLKRLRAMDYKL